MVQSGLNVAESPWRLAWISRFERGARRGGLRTFQQASLPQTPSKAAVCPRHERSNAGTWVRPNRRAWRRVSPFAKPPEIEGSHHPPEYGEGGQIRTMPVMVAKGGAEHGGADALRDRRSMRDAAAFSAGAPEREGTWSCLTKPSLHWLDDRRVSWAMGVINSRKCGMLL